MMPLAELVKLALTAAFVNPPVRSVPPRRSILPALLHEFDELDWNVPPFWTSIVPLLANPLIELTVNVPLEAVRRPTESFWMKLLMVRFPLPVINARLVMMPELAASWIVPPLPPTAPMVPRLTKESFST